MAAMARTWKNFIVGGERRRKWRLELSEAEMRMMKLEQVESMYALERGRGGALSRFYIRTSDLRSCGI